MPRAHSIYLVHVKGHPELIIAGFTVKHESQRWAESTGDIDNLARFRIKDGKPSGRILVPWN